MKSWLRKEIRDFMLDGKSHNFRMVEIRMKLPSHFTQIGKPKFEILSQHSIYYKSNALFALKFRISDRNSCDKFGVLRTMFYRISVFRCLPFRLVPKSTGIGRCVLAKTWLNGLTFIRLSGNSEARK